MSFLKHLFRLWTPRPVLEHLTQHVHDLDVHSIP